MKANILRAEDLFEQNLGDLKTKRQGRHPRE